MAITIAQLDREFAEQKNALIGKFRVIDEKASAEERDLNSEEKAEANRIKQAIADLRRDTDAKRRSLEDDAAIRKEFRDLEDELRVKPSTKKKSHRRPDERTIEQRELCRFAQFAAGGMFYQQSPEYREYLDELLEERAITADIASQGGFAVLQENLPVFRDSLQSATFFRKYATVSQVTDAQSLGIVCIDTEMADAEWLQETKASTPDTTDMFGKRSLHPHVLRKTIDVTTKFLRLAANGSADIERRLGYIMGITEEKACLVGDGNEKPLGIFVASSHGVSTARDVVTGHATTIPNPDCFTKALHKIPTGWQADAKLIMHPDIYTELCLFKSTTNEYLFVPSLTDPNKELFRGKEILLSDFAPNTIGAGAYVAVWANLSQYQIAETNSLTLKTLDQTKALEGKVQVFMENNVDGMPIYSSGFSRIKVSA